MDRRYAFVADAAAEDALQVDTALKGLVDALGRVEDADADADPEEKGAAVDSLVNAVGISLVDLLVEEVMEAESLERSNSIIMPERRFCRCCFCC